MYWINEGPPRGKQEKVHALEMGLVKLENLEAWSAVDDESGCGDGCILTFCGQRR